MSGENIKYWALFGERNSGTKYLLSAFKHNFPDLEHTWDYGFKHWYIKGLHPRGIANGTTDLQCKKSINDSDDTLFIYTVRNPYQWLQAMYYRPYHIIHKKGEGFSHFLRKPYQAEADFFETDKRFIESARNIVALRNFKNDHFWNLGKQVRHYGILRQEHLMEDLVKLNERYHITDLPIELPDYIAPREYKILKREEDRQFIKGNLNNIIDRISYNL